MHLICKLTDEDIGEVSIEMNNPEVRHASRGIVIREDGKIAIFELTKKGEYKLPGGGIEENETPEDAFKREILEETGCEIEILENMGITEEYKTLNNFKQISYIFVGKVLNDTGKLNLTKKEIEDGCRQVWVTSNKALELISSCYNIAGLDYIDKFMFLRDRKILEKYIQNI